MKTLSKVVALVLSVVMLMSSIPMMTFGLGVDASLQPGTATGTNGYYNVISRKDWVLVPDAATETELVLNNATGTRRQVLHVIEVDPSNPDVSIVPGYYGLDKDLTDVANQTTAKLTDMAAYYENTLGYNIVGGMNTDLYYDTNAPRILVYNGQDLSIKGKYAPSSSILYVFKEEDGSISCDVKAYVKADFDAYLASGRLLHAVSVSFGMVVKNGELVSKTEERTSAPAARSMVGIKADGTLVICMNDGRSANNSVGLCNYEEGEVMLALGCEWAANCDGGGSSTFLTKRAGEETFTMRSVPCDGAERPTAHGIFVASNVGPTGELDVININSEYDYFAPKTTYTFGAQAIDTNGYGMTMPADVTWALSDASFGTIDNGTFVSNGKLGEVDVQALSNGTVYGTKTITVANPATLILSATSTVMPYSTTEKVREITMPIVAQIGEANVYYDMAALTIELSDAAAGTLNGYKFTATTDTTVTGVDVTMTYVPTGAKLVYAIEFGQGSEILWDFENNDLGGFLGQQDAYDWQAAQGIESPMNSILTAGNASLDVHSKTFIATKENGGQVHNGQSSLGISFDMRNADINSWVYANIYNVSNTDGSGVLRDVANGKKAVALGAWVYIPEGFYTVKNAGAMAIRGDFVAGTSAATAKRTNFNATYNGKTINSLTEADIPENRWIYAVFTLSGYNYVSINNSLSTDNYSPCFARMYMKPSEVQNLTYYFDDFALDYSSAVDDRNPPVISDVTYCTADTNVEMNGQTITTNAVSFNANIADYKASNAEGLDYASAKIYVDGVALDNVKTTANGMSVDGVVLSNGEHKITFEIADKLGNATCVSKTLVIDCETAASAVTLAGHNDLNNAIEAGSVYYVDIVADAIEDIQEVTTTIELHSSCKWEFDQVNAADGFAVTVTRNAVDEDFITLTIKKTGDCALTGKQTLASVPVRVWSYDETWAIDQFGKTQTTDARYAASGEPVLNVEAAVRLGSIVYTDGTTGSFMSDLLVATKLDGTKTGGAWHKHDAELTVLSAEATCTKNGYENRTYCETCGSVVDWGTVIEATGHSYGFVENVLKCVNDDCDVTFTGTWTDGKDYVDGVTVADGWHGDYYYVNGVKLTGLQNIDGAYYNFDENGKSQGKTNGLITIDGVNYCTIAGNLVNGWQLIENEYYYFDPITNAGINGVRSSLEVCNTSQKFEYSFTNGKLDDGVWLEMAEGTRYYYGSGHYGQGTYVIDGKTYGFNSKGYRYEGFCVIRWNPKSNYQLFEYTADGVYVGEAYDSGVYTTTDGSIYYLTNGVASAPGLVNYEGDYYFFGHGYMTARTNGTYNIAEANTNGLLPAGSYTFGADGKMLQGIVTDANGKIRYYVNGNPSYAGLVKDDNGDFYYFSGSTMAAVTNGAYSVSKTNGLLATGTYYFGADGKMLQGLLTDANGNIRYYVNGKPTYAGLVQDANGDYYYISGSAMNAIVNTTRYISFTNGLLPAGTYAFGADGKMLQGVVIGADGKIRYYVNGQPSYAGLVQDANGDYYYFSGSTMTAIVNTSYNVSKTNGLLATGVYTFGADGKMLQGIVKGADGKVRYYVNGKATYAGLIRDTDGSYYYISGSTLTAVTNSTRYISFTNGLVPNGTYSFGADGKMTTKQGVVKCADGKIRYYEQDVAVYAGLVRDTDGSYYYISGSTLTAITNTTRHITFTNDLLPAGTYTFGADGKMILD